MCAFMRIMQSYWCPKESTAELAGIVGRGACALGAAGTGAAEKTQRSPSKNATAALYKHTSFGNSLRL